MKKVETHFYISRKIHFLTKIARKTKKKWRFLGAIFELFDPSLAPEGPKLIFFAFIIFVGKKLIKMICHMPF